MGIGKTDDKIYNESCEVKNRLLNIFMTSMRLTKGGDEMGKKVLVIVGSPRRGGNSDAMADAFTRGAETAGAEVRRINVSELKIKACTACEQCWESDRPCVFQDDMEKAYPLIEWADMFVFAFPLYYYTYPAQLKMFIDKLFPYEVRHTEATKDKETALLACGGTDDPSEFDGLVSTYRITCGFKGWKGKGVLCAHGLNSRDDILNTDWQEKARQLGESLG